MYVSRIPVSNSAAARLLESDRDAELDAPIRNVMTRGPAAVQRGDAMAAAVDILTARRISELPVVDDDGRPVGLLDITDLVGFQLAGLPGDDPVESEPGQREPASVTVPFPRPHPDGNRGI